MKHLMKNKVLSIILILLLISTFLGGVAFLFDGRSNDEHNGNASNDSISNSGSTTENNNSDHSTSVVDFSKLTYVALGDSITAGTYLDVPYPYLVGDILGTDKIYNYGVNASTISVCNDGRISQHNPMVLSYGNMVDADIVSVMAGINDWIHFHDFGTIESTENDTLYGALKILCQGLKDKYPNSFVFFITPYDSSVKKNREETPKLVGEIIKEVCALYDIPVLDLYSKGHFVPSEHSSDGLHPSQEFMKQYTAPQIAAFIKSNYK